MAKQWKYGDTGTIHYCRNSKFPVGTRVKLVGNPGGRGVVTVQKVSDPSAKLSIHVSDLED